MSNTSSNDSPSGFFQAGLDPVCSLACSGKDVRLGICLSGGGSRALTCALGQLSGLSALPHPDYPNDSSKSLLDRVDYLSSVSGGTWASVLFTFMPEAINGQSVKDDDILIKPVDPNDLVKAQETNADPANVSYMAPFCIGTAPQQTSIGNFIKKLAELTFKWNLLTDGDRRRWSWIILVGEFILKPFGLYDALYERKKDYIEPTKYFSLSVDHINSCIKPDNPSIDPAQFYTCRSNRPSLIVNSNLIQNIDSCPQIPLQSTPICCGAVGQSPDATIKGGGSVESFGFSADLQGPGSKPETAKVAMERCYSLCDIAGCSSAFFAEWLAEHIYQMKNEIFQEINNMAGHIHDHSNCLVNEWASEMEALMEKHSSPSAKSAISECHKALSEAANRLDQEKTLMHTQVAQFFNQHCKLGNSASNGFIPQYNYWPLDQVTHEPPQNTTFCFSDGGCFDNTGILGLLARTDANRIIAFVNSQTPIKRDSGSNEIIVDGQIPLLFGFKSGTEEGKYVSYGGMSPEEPMSYVQVFSNGRGEFAALRQGLYDASCGGPNLDESLGTCTAAFTQVLTTVENPVARIEAGRQVKVLWIYNNRVNKWQDAIQDENIKNDLERGQANQDKKGMFQDDHHADDPKSQGMVECDLLPWGPLFNFPYYSTFLQICLNKEAVNMLAQLSAWNVKQLKDDISNLLV